jgi:hypothetical protein
LKELITEQQAHALVIGLSVAVTVLSLAAALYFSRRKDLRDPHLVWPYALASALLGPVLFILWAVYNAIENHYGLDSVKALLINLVIFVLTGIVAAVLFARIPSWVNPGKTPRKK